MPAHVFYPLIPLVLGSLILRNPHKMDPFAIDATDAKREKLMLTWEAPTVFDMGSMCGERLRKAEKLVSLVLPEGQW